MRRVKRTAVIVKPKQPYIDWANSLEDGSVKLGEDYVPEHTIQGEGKSEGRHNMHFRQILN